MNNAWTAREVLEGLTRLVDEHPDDADKPLTIDISVFPYSPAVSVGPRSARKGKVWTIGWRSDAPGLSINARLGT